MHSKSLRLRVDSISGFLGGTENFTVTDSSFIVVWSKEESAEKKSVGSHCFAWLGSEKGLTNCTCWNTGDFEMLRKKIQDITWITAGNSVAGGKIREFD